MMHVEQCLLEIILKCIKNTPEINIYSINVILILKYYTPESEMTNWCE